MVPEARYGAFLINASYGKINGGSRSDSGLCARVRLPRSGLLNTRADSESFAKYVNNNDLKIYLDDFGLAYQIFDAKSEHKKKNEIMKVLIEFLKAHPKLTHLSFAYSGHGVPN